MNKPPQVVVHDRVQAEAALAAAEELGCAIRLRSAPDAAAYAGVGYLKALGDLVGHEIVVDCGEDAGLVMAALRTGCRRLAFSKPAAVSERLAEMAAQLHVAGGHALTGSCSCESGSYQAWLRSACCWGAAAARHPCSAS